MSIVIAVLSILSCVFLRETSAAVILGRRGARITKETGKPFMIPGPMPEMPPKPQQPTKEIVSRSLVRPMKMLIFLPQVLILSFYTAFVFGLIYLLFTTFPAVFEGQYGLCYCLLIRKRLFRK